MRRALRALVTSGAVLLAAASSASVARAQSSPPPPSTQNEAAGRALFEEGRRLMQAGDAPAACAKFEEGQRISPGIGMKYNLAECYEKTGKIASAWSAFLDVAGLSRAQGQAERERAARERANALEPKVPRLTVNVPASSRVDGLTITRDGTPMGSAQWGVAIPIDPGRHVIEASAPGRTPATLTVDITQGTEKGAVIPALAVVAVAPPPPGGTPPPVTPPPADTEHTGRTQRIVGLGAGGLGLVGIGVGVTFGLLAQSKNADSESQCSGDQCSREGLVLRDAAMDRATVSTISFVAGGVLLAGGIVLLLTAPRAAARTGIDARGVVVRF